MVRFLIFWFVDFLWPFYKKLRIFLVKWWLKINKSKYQKSYHNLTEKWSSKRALKFSEPNIENCRRRYIFSGAFLLKILIWDNWILVDFLRFFTYKTANFWGIDHKSSQNMHFICIYHISKGLNLKNIFEFFTTKLLLKEQTYVYLKNPFFVHISVNFCPILKIFGTVTIRKTRSLS